MRLNIFHAMQRISKLCKKHDGAFKPFMARLRDVCFIVNLDDIKEASAVGIFFVGRINGLTINITILGLIRGHQRLCIMPDIHSRFKLQVEQALAGQGMTPEAIAEYKDNNWTYFLRNCRRLVPERPRLLERFNSVIEMFRNVVDAKSGEVLLRRKAMQAVNQLRKHMEADCLSDPEGVPLFYTTGQKAAGITTRCYVQGTNCTEVPVLFAPRCTI